MRCTPNGEVREIMCSTLETWLVDHNQLNRTDGLGQNDSKDLSINQSVAEQNARDELKAVKAVVVLPLVTL